jgi:hypothetical protein
MPPDTGASSIATPLAASMSWTRRMSSGEFVVWSM